ncbi:MAG TPA: GNAT family N-acetyltransferase [Myxococcales bacterium]|nr:GNAT family N-acetyltransferase [Myxococcales bacterium]
MKLRFAESKDIALLSQLNHELIEDERAPNPMSIDELNQRMTTWLEGDYRAVIFELESSDVAYALYREEKDGLYLRQFYVVRDRRRQGIGQTAIELFREQVVGSGQTLTLEVFSHNETGIVFWRALGFQEHSIAFRI